MKNIDVNIKDYEYVIEFRHHSWNTEGLWELLKQYNIANVITDSPEKENLSFLTNSLVTSSDHSFIHKISWEKYIFKPLLV